MSGAFDLFDEKLDKAASRDYDHFKELNPDATPADYNRMHNKWTISTLGDFIGNDCV